MYKKVKVTRKKKYMSNASIIKLRKLIFKNKKMIHKSISELKIEYKNRTFSSLTFTT